MEEDVCASIFACLDMRGSVCFGSTCKLMRMIAPHPWDKYLDDPPMTPLHFTNRYLSQKLLEAELNLASVLPSALHPMTYNLRYNKYARYRLVHFVEIVCRSGNRLWREQTVKWEERHGRSKTKRAPWSIWLPCVTNECPRVVDTTPANVSEDDADYVFSPEPSSDDTEDEESWTA